MLVAVAPADSAQYSQRIRSTVHTRAHGAARLGWLTKPNLSESANEDFDASIQRCHARYDSVFAHGPTLTLSKLRLDDYHDPANLKAVFTVSATGAPIPGATVMFMVGFQSCNAVTNASGVANCSLVLNHAAGNVTVSASTTGIFAVFIGNSTSQPFAVTLEQTTLSYTGDTVIANGGTAHMSGVLLEDNVTPIAGRSVTFTLGTGASAQKCNGITNGTGKAACTISPVAQPLGPVSVGDSFAGDAFYLPASASTGAMLFAFLSQGSFILGDQSAQPGAHWTFCDMFAGQAPIGDYNTRCATEEAASSPALNPDMMDCALSRARTPCSGVSQVS